MKYIDALKKYNEGKTKWCMPRKGSEDYIKIKKMIDINYSHKNKILLKSKERSRVSTNNVINSPISKESKRIIDKISKKPNLKKSSNLFITDKRVQKIQKFFKKFAVKDKYTLDNRVKYYNYLINYIKDIKKNECVNKYTEDNVTKYTIADKLFLIKKIGTESVNGVIYLTILKNVLGGNLLASKITPISKDNYKEINIMKNLTDNVISQKKSRHFLMMYKFFVCPKNKLGIQVSNNKRLISINELAHGDLKMLMKDRSVIANDELVYNIFIQTFLSITSFHNLAKYYHNDAHHGNFLYQKNKEVGYYHYVFKRTDYYLKACEYNIMIYDFGYASKFKKKSNKNAMVDYMRIINAFMNTYYGWGEYSNLPSTKINTEMVFIRKELEFEFYHGNKENILEHVIFNNIILKSLENRFSNYNLFTKNKPDKIINKTPYIIG
jgi:hypothetical protein